MGFKQSSFYEGIEDHTMTERDPRLPDGNHRVRIKECTRFISYRKKIPCSLIRVELQSTDSTSAEARVGDTYGILFMCGEHKNYFFNDLKRFMSAALSFLMGREVKPDEVSAENLEDAFIEKDEAETKKTVLADVPLHVIVKTAPYTNQKGATYDKTTYDFRTVFHHEAD